MRQTAEGLALTLYLGIPRPIWEAFWLATTHDETWYRETFRTLYHLEIGSMEVDDAPVEAVVVVDGYTDWWLGVSLFLLSPGGSCVDGCPQTQLP